MLSSEKNKNWQRWLLAILVGLLVVFGLVTIVFEEWTINLDNIVNILPAEPVVFYMHFDQRIDEEKNWSSAPAVLKDYFSQQLSADLMPIELVNKIATPEYALAVFAENDQLLSAWIMFWPKTDIPASLFDYQFATSGPWLIVSPAASKIKQNYFQTNWPDNKLSTKVWPKFTRPTTPIYLYADTDRLPRINQTFNLTGAWRLEVFPGQMQLTSLTQAKTNKTKSNYFLNNWPRIFFDQNLVLYNAAATDLKWLLENQWLQPNLVNYSFILANMTGIDLGETIGKIHGPINLVLSNKIDKSNPEWLLAMPNQAIIKELFTKAVSQYLGYADPVVREKKLPDNSLVYEYIAEPKEVDWQTFYLANQLVQIVYFSNKDYFFWAEIDGLVVFGNNLNYLNDLLTKHESNKPLPICLEKADFSLIFNKNNNIYSIIRSINNKNQVNYTICY